MRKMLLIGVAGVSVALALQTVGGSSTNVADALPALTADKIAISKSRRQLTLLRNDTIVKTYRVTFGPGVDEGPKTCDGDKKTPEGEYHLTKVAHSNFHRALLIDYPSHEDRRRAAEKGCSPGGMIEIHGVQNRYRILGSLSKWKLWTDGCIAVTDPEIEEIYDAVANGAPVVIGR